jgi:hypothetical protein
VASKNIQDQLRAVQYAAGKCGFKIAQLCGREVVVEENQIGLGGSHHRGNLFNLPGADQSGRIGTSSTLKHFGSHHTTGAGNQLAKFG